jgi:hypothetical protein
VNSIKIGSLKEFFLELQKPETQSEGARLKKVISNFNSNLDKCGADIVERDGSLTHIFTPEEAKALKIKAPDSVLTSVQLLARAEAFAAQTKKKLGGLQFELE